MSDYLIKKSRDYLHDSYSVVRQDVQNTWVLDIERNWQWESITERVFLKELKKLEWENIQLG
jgi:hypothetical protein